MENILHANIRNHVYKGDNHRLRRKGAVPGIVYGLNTPNMLVEFSELELFHILEKSGEHGTLNIDVNGKNESTMIKEVQRDPITRKVTHIDLQRIDNSKKVHARVPILLKGEEYYKNSGTIVQQQISEVEVECMPDKLPKYIIADAAKISSKNKITVGDLEISEEITILNNPYSTVLTLANIKNDIGEESPKEVSVNTEIKGE